MIAGAAQQDVLRVGLESPVHTLDPGKAQDLVSALVVRQVFETPFLLDANSSSVTSRILEMPLRSEGPLVYSAAVRPGIRFSDGTRLDAGLLAAALSRVEPLKEQAAVESDGDRVRMSLRRPNSRFDLTLTQTFCAITRQKVGGLLGTGPYRVARQTRNALHLVRNPCFEGPVGFGEILFTVYPPGPNGDNEALVRAIEAGEVDFTNAISRNEAEGLRGVRTWIEPGNSTAILYFNIERLTDREVRRALALAINRQEVAGAFYSNALAFTASSLLPRVMGAVPDDLTYDLQKALMLLGRPGVERPARLRLLLIWSSRPYLPQPRAAAEWIARYLGRLGIETEIVAPASSSEYFRAEAAGDYDMVLSGWIADTPDPADFLEANLSSQMIPAPGKDPVNSTNSARFRHEATDRALARYRESPSLACKTEILGLVAEEVPLLPLMYGPTIFVHSRRVANFKPRGFGIPNLAELRPAET